MWSAATALRRVLGIRDYRPGPTPPARVQKPTWHGARGRRHWTTWTNLDLPTDPCVERISREHRIIRQMIADIERERDRGQE